MRRILALALVTIAVTAHAAHAGEVGSRATERVRLAEVHASDARNEPLLRAAALDALGKLDLTRVPARNEAVMSVAIVKLDDETRGPTRSVTCVVSASLRARKSGNLVAVLEGRAHAEGRGAIEPAGVIAAAAEGAIARVPEALR
jgi:hypothetical protein